MTPRSHPRLFILPLSVLSLIALEACKPQSSGTPKRATKVAGAKAQSAGSSGTTSAQGAANPAATNAAMPPPKTAKPAQTQAVAAGASAAVAPTMPSTWKVQEDAAIPAAKIQGIARHLGGAIRALRNTIYTVGAARVQINTIIAASSDGAKKIVATLGRMKRPDTFLRRGTVVYEFVGNNDALPAIKAGRAQLAGAR